MSTNYVYDDNDRITSQGGTSYTYDDNGNTLTESIDSDVTTYTYDAKNKLTGVEKTVLGTTTNSSYTYNADGIRTSQTVEGTETKYVVDSNRDYAQVLFELDSADAVQVQYTYGDDLISQDRAGSVSYYHYDGLGSTRALSDSSGTVTDTYNYEAFGELLNSTGSSDNSYLYTGEQYDQFLGQQYLRARYYDSGIGRFTQQDTYMGSNSDPITLHKYLYANADPGNMIDPTGNFSIGSMMSTVNTMAQLSMRAYSSYSNVTALIQLANGETTLNELAFNYLALKILPRKFFKCKNSFTEGTLVHTENGLKPIDDIAIGDKVWSYNEETGEKSLQEVIHLVNGSGTKELVDIELISGEIITTTDNHPFYLPEVGIWANAGDLENNSILSGYGAESLGIKNLSTYSKDLTVYNLSVANDHNYYVGESGALAHNCYQKPEWKTYQRGKHQAPKGLSTNNIRISTKSGPAKYYLNNANDLKKFELDAWKKGIPTKKNPLYKVVEHPQVIGAKYGRDVRWQRLEYDKTSNTIHGHPITREEYMKYLRD